MKLSSDAFLEGYYYKPRVDWELLERYHRGPDRDHGLPRRRRVAGAACATTSPRPRELAARLQDIFGRDNLFVELQDHGLADQRRTNPQLIEIARSASTRRCSPPTTATTAAREDAEAHDALLCVQTGSTHRRPEPLQVRAAPALPEVRGRDARRSSARSPRPATTRCGSPSGPTSRSSSATPTLPEFPSPRLRRGRLQGRRRRLPAPTSPSQGAEERYGDAAPRRVVERLDYELGVIADMGFSAYFLVVWDLIKHARDNNIRVGPGRGSAAGCCVAYCLRIVDLDPIRYDLLFERFLNPGRKQMPDIDMDFDERYRAEMIRYAAERYGCDHVAQIVTFSTIKARAAVRDAAACAGLPYAVGDKIAKAMPPLVMGRDTPL